MQIVRQADVHDIQFLLLDHLFEVRIDLLATEQLGAIFRLFDVHIAACYEIHAFLSFGRHAVEW